MNKYNIPFIHVIIPKCVNIAIYILCFIRSMYTRSNKRNDQVHDNSEYAFQQFKEASDTIRKKLSSSSDEYLEVLQKRFQDILASLAELAPMLNDVKETAHLYDLSEDNPGNGYRSFVIVTGNIIRNASGVLVDYRRRIQRKDLRFLEAVNEAQSLLLSITKMFKYLMQIKSESEVGALHSSKTILVNEILKLAKEINQECFYGRFLANACEPAVANALKFISISLTTYSELYFGSPFWIVPFRFFKYVFNDTARGNRHVAISKICDAKFIKAYWSCSETVPLMILMKVLNPISVSDEILFYETSVVIDGVTVEAPFPGRPIRGRLVSSRVRQGMKMAKRSSERKSRGLVIQVHGGGFISQTPRAQEHFIRPWAHAMDVPIFCIDYCLAPDHPFPEQHLEVFYAYCLAIAYAERLGTTAERVVFTGDSAGGTLILSAMLECVSRGIRLPHGLLLCYVPLFISATPSPSRLLGIMDPLLPMSFIIRCMEAYVQGEVPPPKPPSTCTCEKCQNTTQYSLLDNPHLELDVSSFHLNFPTHKFFCPLSSPKEMLIKLPPITLVAATMDGLLDDSVMFAKKMKEYGGNVELVVVDGLPHGFLNFYFVCEKTKMAAKMCCNKMMSYLNDGCDL